MNWYSKNMQEGEMLSLESFHITNFKNIWSLEVYQEQNSAEGVFCSLPSRSPGNMTITGDKTQLSSWYGSQWEWLC